MLFDFLFFEQKTAYEMRISDGSSDVCSSDLGDDPLFHATFARINEIAGDPIRSGEAWAEAAYLNGRPERALVQLNNLKKRSDLDYYARARIEARIAAITPVVLELRRQGIRDPDLDRR